MRFVLPLSQTILLEVPVLAYYNEFDPQAAAWLEQLIADGEIAYGYVDRRSICDVSASELAGFTQCHFFAGIGGWSRALRLAGVSDDTPIWTGSCPCQPFSSAGKGDGLADPRHLWPHFFRIISALKPARVVGEQVASPDALVWWDAVCADLEGAGYAGWAADLCSAGIGAPHIRQRLYWVAGSNDAGLEGRESVRQRADECPAWAGGVAGRLADAAGGGYRERERDAGTVAAAREGCKSEESGSRRAAKAAWNYREDGWLGDALHIGLQGAGNVPVAQQSVESESAPESGLLNDRAGPIDSIRRDADWLHCRDGKWRPVKPGIVPLVDGLPRGVVPSSRIGMAFDADKTAEARTMRLKGYGNAIDPELAAMFLRAVS